MIADSWGMEFPRRRRLLSYPGSELMYLLLHKRVNKKLNRAKLITFEVTLKCRLAVGPKQRKKHTR